MSSDGLRLSYDDDLSPSSSPPSTNDNVPIATITPTASPTPIVTNRDDNDDDAQRNHPRDASSSSSPLLPPVKRRRLKKIPTEDDAMNDADDDDAPIDTPIAVGGESSVVVAHPSSTLSIIIEPVVVDSSTHQPTPTTSFVSDRLRERYEFDCAIRLSREVRTRTLMYNNE